MLQNLSSKVAWPHRKQLPAFVRIDRQKFNTKRLVCQIHELVREHPRFGYRRITVLLRREGWQVNAKRVYRLWRQEGLKVPKKQRFIASGIGPPGPKAGRRPPQIRTSAIDASGSSGLWFRYMLE